MGLLENLKKVTSKTPFAIGSISKSLTALAIVKLIEDKNKIRGSRSTISPLV